MHRSRGYIASALLLLLAGISAKLLAQDQKLPSQEERAKADNSGVLKTVQGSWSMVKDLQVSASSEVMQGYRLDLLVSADGKSYSLALHDTKNSDGLFSVFSDQNGIIFLGSPLQ